ncbi:hypothetical protein TrCOL_g5826 [Triparma columacea]|uniref:Uncharacterized protein n=1 Tax=Triparma columacea TaxID=722753 RepID=A0A9W7GI36_9STRA|nr:hypothetical protein TrCOL_g5826 [Triparma columacea]
MFGRKKRIVPQTSIDFGGKQATSRQERLCGLAKEARALLKPWAQMQEDKLSLYEPIYNKSLGQHEGVGMLLRMGRLDTKNTGSITPEEEREFLRNMLSLADETLGFLSNCMIISTLTLGISIPLSIHEVTLINLESPTLGGSDEDTLDFYEAWLNRPTIMHAVHIVELILLSYSIWKSSCGILNSLLLYSTLSIYLPDVESKLRFMVLRRDMLLVAFELGLHALISFLCALPLCAAKFSPPASIILCLPFLGFIYYAETESLIKIGNPAMLYQHKLVRELFTEEELLEDKADAGPKGDFHTKDFHDFRDNPRMISPKANVAGFFRR